MSIYSKETLDNAYYATTQALTPFSMEQSTTAVCDFTYTVATPAAKTFLPGVAEISDVVCAADAGVKEVQTLTFQTKASSTQGDYVAVYDYLGNKYAVSVDKDASGSEPSGAIWAGIHSSRKRVVYTSAVSTAAQCAAKFAAALAQIPEFIANVTVLDNTDGTLTLTQKKVGSTSNPVPKNVGDTGAGGILGVQTTAGVASSLNNTYFSLHAGGTDAEHVFWFNVNGEGTAPSVSGATLHEVELGAGDADTAVATALHAIVDATDEFSSSKSTATLTITAGTKGNTTNANDSGTCGFTITTTTAGVTDAFATGFTSDILTIPSHGYYTGLKAALTTSAADLPNGLSATDYWIKKLDANTITLHTSAAHAVAGTGQAGFSDEGTGTHTLTPAAISGGAVKLQESGDGVNWYDISGATGNITATGTQQIQITSKCPLCRPYLTVTTGQIQLSASYTKKG